MKKTSLYVAVAAVLGATAPAVQATTMTFFDGPNDGTPFNVGVGLTTPSAVNATPFTTTPPFPPPNPRNSEFRMIDPGGTLGGGGEKSIFSGGETWEFCSGCGAMQGTSTGNNNPGAFAGAAPLANTNETTGVAAPFFGNPFNFLAPSDTNLAGQAYGAASISFTSGDNFSVFFPTLEAQWGGTYFPLAAVTLDCVGALSGSFHCAGEHTITTAEDPGGAGFSGWTAQWNLHGTVTPHPSAIPVPAAVWLFGSGLMGLVGVARRRRTS